MNPPEALDPCPEVPDTRPKQMAASGRNTPSAGPTLTSLTHPYNRVAFPHSICFDAPPPHSCPAGSRLRGPLPGSYPGKRNRFSSSHCMTRPDVRVRVRPSVIRVSAKRTRVRPVIRVTTDQQDPKHQHYCPLPPTTTCYPSAGVVVRLRAAFAASARTVVDSMP